MKRNEARGAVPKAYVYTHIHVKFQYAWSGKLGDVGRTFIILCAAGILRTLFVYAYYLFGAILGSYVSFGLTGGYYMHFSA